MNKVISTVVIACGLLLLDSPEAAAHEESYSRDGYRDSERYYDRDQYRAYGGRDARHGQHRYGKLKREKRMPRWLKHDRSFHHWYEHSRLRKNRQLSWHQLFDIYRWENSYRRYRRH